MSDQIILFRKIDNEPTPRFYAMTGADFQTMLAAVKSLTFRAFDAGLKAWMVRGDAIKTLKDQGYEVKERPALRLSEIEKVAGWTSAVQVAIEHLSERGEYRPVKFIAVRYTDETDLAAQIAILKDKVTAARKALCANQTRTKDAWKSAIADLQTL